MATHPTFLARKILWIEVHDELRSIGCQGSRVTKATERKLGHRVARDQSDRAQAWARLPLDGGVTESSPPG